jgi:hypothetical protein
MAANDSSTARPGVDLNALAAIFSEIAYNANSARRLAIQCVGEDEDINARAQGAEALIGIIGQLADRAARAVGSSPMLDADDWTCTPVAVRALRGIGAL